MAEEVAKIQSQTDNGTSGAPCKKRKVEDEAGEGSYAVVTDHSITQSVLEQVDNCQAKIDELNEHASEEILSIEQKYNKLRKPFFDHRNELIQKIPNFWVTAFVNHPQISAVLTEEEEECLHYLEKVEVEEFDDIKSGYKIKFHFQSNPYFDNDILCKEFNSAQTDEHSGETVSHSIPVRWKDDEVDLTKTIPQEMPGQRRRRSGLIQTFFTWYLDNSEPHMDDIAEVIKDDMWPNPLQYYLASDTEVEENGVESDEEGVNEGEEVVIGTDDEEGQEEENPEEVLLDEEDAEEEKGGGE